MRMPEGGNSPEISGDDPIACSVEIKPRYVAGLKRLAELTQTSIDVIVNQAISDTLEAS